jgi:hypothetical protein
MRNPLEEYYVLSEMKAAAENEGLWIEVKAAYDSYKKSGYAPEEAAFSALYDWDITL